VADLALTFDSGALLSAVKKAVHDAIAERSSMWPQSGGERLAYSEPEAARMLGLEEHVLRDERRRGRISASKIVGRRIRYTREDLTDYLASRRVRS
jgi:hypothetical protein